MYLIFVYLTLVCLTLNKDEKTRREGKNILSKKRYNIEKRRGSNIIQDKIIFIFYILYFALYIVYFALCILQFALCTLYIKRKLNKSDITTNNITGIINVTDTHFISKY